MCVLDDRRQCRGINLNLLQRKPMAKKKIKTIKPRNWLALHARRRSGGPMKDRKKAADKKACRGRVRA
tara:strand:- start:96 stop:299 length:204 start_codon:yes stop_codon:yes gene_type:complete